MESHNNHSYLRRILSWIVLSIAFGLLRSCSFIVFDYITKRFNIILICISLIVLYIPLGFFIQIVLKASEGVCPSRKGTRYHIYAGLYIISALIDIAVYGKEAIALSIFDILLATLLIKAYKLNYGMFIT